MLVAATFTPFSRLRVQLTWVEMLKHRDPIELAMNYHRALPARLRQYLNGRGIPDALIDFHLLGWNSNRITIPIYNRDGGLVFYKLAKDPKDQLPGPKIMASPGAFVELYGWEHIRSKPTEIIICEGEFDRLVLEAQGFRSVTSTGGASTFRSEWIKEFESIPEVYICFDRDEAGRGGALRVGQLIRHARIIELPEEVGDTGDITDFFVRLKRSRKDFLRLMMRAKPAPPPPEPAPVQAKRTYSDSPRISRVEQIKTQLSITKVIGQYVQLKPSGNKFIGLCPFHEDHFPSLTVYTESRTFYCFGCRKHGDVIAFVMGIEHLNFLQALDALDRLLKEQNGRESQTNN